MQVSTKNNTSPKRPINLALTENEKEVLVDIALGLTDLAIAERRYLSRRGVTSRLHSLYRKLRISKKRTVSGAQSYNLRNRAVVVAFLRGALTRDLLRREEELWQNREFQNDSSRV